MAGSRDYGMLAVGFLIGAIVTYFLRNQIAGLLSNVGGTQSLYANVLPYHYVARRYQ